MMTKDSNQWQAYRRSTVDRFSIHWLAFAELHKEPTAANYDDLEAEHPVLMTAVQHTYQRQQWEFVRHYAKLVASPRDGYLTVRGFWQDCRQCLEMAIKAADAEGHQRDAVALAGNLAEFERKAGRYESAQTIYERSLSFFKRAEESGEVAAAYHQLGLLAEDQGNYQEARRLYVQSLCLTRQMGNQMGISASIHQLGMVARLSGNLKKGRRLLRYSLALDQKLGNLSSTASTLHELGNIAYLEGQYAQATKLYLQSLDLKMELGHQEGMATTLNQLGNVACLTKNYALARQFYQQSLKLYQTVGHSKGVEEMLSQLYLERE